MVRRSASGKLPRRESGASGRGAPRHDDEVMRHGSNPLAGCSGCSRSPPWRWRAARRRRPPPLPKTGERPPVAVARRGGARAGGPGGGHRGLRLRLPAGERGAGAPRGHQRGAGRPGPRRPWASWPAPGRRSRRPGPGRAAPWTPCRSRPGSTSPPGRGCSPSPRPAGGFHAVTIRSAWNDLLDVTGGKGAKGRATRIAVASTGWAGKPPAGVRVVRSPTALVRVEGRVLAVGGPNDRSEAQAVARADLAAAARGQPEEVRTAARTPGRLARRDHARPRPGPRPRRGDLLQAAGHAAQGQPAGARPTPPSSRRWRTSGWCRARTTTRPASTPR